MIDIDYRLYWGDEYAMAEMHGNHISNAMQFLLDCHQVIYNTQFLYSGAFYAEE